MFRSGLGMHAKHHFQFPSPSLKTLGTYATGNAFKSPCYTSTKHVHRSCQSNEFSFKLCSIMFYGIQLKDLFPRTYV